jgi:hypothetical protein
VIVRTACTCDRRVNHTVACSIHARDRYVHIIITYCLNYYIRLDVVQKPCDTSKARQRLQLENHDCWCARSSICRWIRCFASIPEERKLLRALKADISEEKRCWRHSGHRLTGRACISSRGSDCQRSSQYHGGACLFMLAVGCAILFLCAGLLAGHGASRCWPCPCLLCPCHEQGCNQLLLAIENDQIAVYHA